MPRCTPRSAAGFASSTRTLLRERSIDPLTEVDAVRALVEQVVDDFLIACADGTPGMPTATPRREDLIDAVGDSVTGFGPLQRYLDDPNIEEIWINHPSRVFVARNGRSELTSTVLTDSGVRDLVERMPSRTSRDATGQSTFESMCAQPANLMTSFGWVR